MFITPTLNISCITCMKGNHHDEEGSNKKKQSGGKENNSVVPELYGGITGGGPWDDGIHDGIREINLVYGKCIDSMCVFYDKNGKLVKGERRGGHGMGSELNKPLSNAEIKLEYPEEFLVSISGYYSGVNWIVGDPVILRSLTFESNKRTFGPFGVQVGTPFNFRVQDGEKIVGFKGRDGWHLDAIGFHILKPPDLYGGTTGGGPWDDGSFDGIREITLVYGQCIDSLCVVYKKNGELIIGDTHGGHDQGSDLHKPLNTVQIKLEYPNEFLVSVTGHYCGVTWIVGAPVVLRSLEFKSNRRTFGPFGIQVGTPFTFRVKDGEQIVGLKGRNGWHLDAIGFHTSRVPERGLFVGVRKGFWKAYESLVKLTTRLTGVECTCISL
ncbi:agglutinin-like [Argentina anserina]|uniref:agglutinin-like n=1 Tax=Argentina anserina TaxID=57926 RepID=UPI0021763B93|nr:agglutinin-like [Potentilla anserina]